jgi:hypothetical protein
MNCWTSHGRVAGGWVGLLLLLSLSGCAQRVCRTPPAAATGQRAEGVFVATPDCGYFPDHWANRSTLWRPFVPMCTSYTEVIEGLPALPGAVEEVPPGAPLRPLEMDLPDASRAPRREDGRVRIHGQQVTMPIDVHYPPAGDLNISGGQKVGYLAPDPLADRQPVRRLGQPPVDSPLLQMFSPP